MKKLIFTLIICFITVHCVFSQTVEEITKGYIQAMGGEENIKNIESVSLEQSVFSNNLEGTQKTICIVGKAFYSETMMMGYKVTVAMKNKKGWQINPYVSTKVTDLTEKEINMYDFQTRFFAPIYDYYKKGKDSYVSNVTLNGEKEIDKDQCTKLIVTYKTKFVDTLYISKKTHLLRKIENSIGSVVYSHYKKINNLMIPYNSEMVNTLGTVTTEVLSAKMNQKINDKIFIKPN